MVNLERTAGSHHYSGALVKEERLKYNANVYRCRIWNRKWGTKDLDSTMKFRGQLRRPKEHARVNSGQSGSENFPNN